jgi:hypothetical protein
LFVLNLELLTPCDIKADEGVAAIALAA